MATVPVILCVDDNAGIRNLVRDYFEPLKYTVLSAVNGNEAMSAAAAGRPDVVLLDLNLENESGLEVLRRFKENPGTCGIPVLVFTAHHKDGQLVESREQGADGYLVKGGPMEQVRGYIDVLIGAKPARPEPELKIGPLRIDPASRRVLVGDRPSLPLTPKEFDLLWHVARKSPEVIPWEKIARAVWNEPAKYGKDSKTIELHAQRLRRKLGPDASPLFVTHRGVGLQLVAAPLR